MECLNWRSRCESKPETLLKNECTAQETPVFDKRNLLIGTGVAILSAAIGLGRLLRVWSSGLPAQLVDATGVPIDGSVSEK